MLREPTGQDYPHTEAHPTPALTIDAGAVLETIPDGFFAVDREWRFVYVNGHAARLLRGDKNELLGRNLWHEFPDLVDTGFQAHLLAAAKSRSSWHFEEYYPPLGKWFEVRLHPTGEEYLSVYFQDVTAKKRTQEALRVSRERLDLVLSSVDVGLWYCDLPFDKLIWNEITKAHFGLPADAEVTIQTFYQRIHPEDRERTRREIEKSIGGHSPFDCEYRTIGLDEKQRWVRATGRPFYDASGKPVRFDGITVEITEYKELLAKERESSAETELLSRIGRMLAAELDLDKLVQAITDAATELTGAAFGSFFYNVTDRAGESYMLYTLSGAPREAFAGFPMPRNTDVFGPTFRGEGVVRSGDITKDPRYGHMAPYHGMPEGHLPVRSYLAVPVASRSGEVIGGLFFGHPEPDRFAANHERMVTSLAAHASIAMDNARLLESMESARVALERSNQELQQVAYIASHDLQEPLRTIASFSQLLNRQYGGKMGPDADELIRRVVDAASRMKTLIDDVLRYSSLSSNDGRFTALVDMERVVDWCVEELRGDIEEMSARVTRDRLPAITKGDRQQLRLLLSNLIGNALKYARPDAEPHIHVSAESAPDAVTFTVTDNGEGFDPQYADRIFGMFRRLHGQEVPGTGIGLALCRRIVELHGGKIWAEGRPGDGAKFHFTLPNN